MTPPPIGSKLSHYLAPTVVLSTGVLASEDVLITFAAGVYVTMWFEANRQDSPGGRVDAEHITEEEA